MAIVNNPPKVVKVIQDYREALMQREMDVLNDMAKHWLKIEQALESDMAALQLTMAQRAVDGKVITQQMIWKEERYQILKGKLTEALKRYNADYLIGAVENAQVDFGWFGVNAASDAIKASYAEGLAPHFPMLNKNAIESMVGFLGNGAPLNSLLKNDYPEALQGLTDALINGIGRGAGTKEIAVNMANGMGMGLNRALLIAGTETNRAYRSGSTQQYRESGVVKGFYRLVSRAGACNACLFLDGERFELASELDDHPRGHCQAVPEVMGMGAPSWEKGKDWFMTLDPEEQKSRLGNALYESWKKEGFDLSSLVSKSHSDEWGDIPRFNAGGGN